MASDNREYERKFLVSEVAPMAGSLGTHLVQGYLFVADDWKARVRRRQTADKNGVLTDGTAMFTLKGPRSGTSSPEYEIELELAHAVQLIDAAPYRIEKTRHPVVSENNVWEVDVFHGPNEGLVIAEFDASAEAVALVKRPWWCSVEVTQDKRFSNENLAREPWPTWQPRWFPPTYSGPR